MFIILLNLLKMGNQLMVQDILYMEGPAGTVVSPTLQLVSHRCQDKILNTKIRYVLKYQNIRNIFFKLGKRLFKHNST